MNFTPIAGCVDYCLRFILLLFAVYILVRDYFLMVYLIVYSFESKRRCASHGRCASSRHHQYILCKDIHFLINNNHFTGKLSKKLSFVQTNTKSVYYTENIQMLYRLKKNKKRSIPRPNDNNMQILYWQ